MKFRDQLPSLVFKDYLPLHASEGAMLFVTFTLGESKLLFYTYSNSIVIGCYILCHLDSQSTKALLRNKPQPAITSPLK